MLGKLMKYDLKSMFKVFVPLWLALLAVSVINRFSVRLDANNPLGALPTVIFMILYVGLIIAAMVVTVALIIMRFYNGLLKDEGYLMFTLPVKPWQLLLSKCLTAAIVTILSFLAAILSVLLVASDNAFFPEFMRFLREAIPQFTGDMVLTVVLVVLLLLAEVIAGVTHIYAALALGHLAQKHRIGYAVLAFIGLDIALTSATFFLAELADRLHISVDLNFHNPVAECNLVLTILLAATLLVIAIHAVITERILAKRLNLE